MSLSIDIPASAFTAFKTVWAERVYLSKLIVVPFIVKFFCLIIVFFSGTGNDVIRQCLIMLPSYFTEGWFIAQFLRTYLTGERWPYPVDLSSVQNEVAIIRRVRGLLGAIISFVLAMMVIAILQASIMAVTGGALGDPDYKPKPEEHAMMVFILAFVVSFFRFLWVPIALVVNTSIDDFVRITKGFLPTFQLFGLWLMTTLPLSILYIILVQLVGSILAGASSQEFLSFISAAFLKSIGEIFVTLLPMVAIATALKPHLKIS